MSLSHLYERYLRLLAIDGLPTGLEGLKHVVRRHLLRAPFENVSKLLLLDAEGAGRPTTLSEFLHGIEYLDLGGTCYAGRSSLRSEERRLRDALEDSDRLLDGATRHLERVRYG